MKVLFSICLTFALTVSLGFAQVVNTTNGAVQGVSLTSRNGRAFHGYLSIPYSKPMIGSLRFKSPQPPEKWSGIRDATSYGPVCPQYSASAPHFVGDEDCLTINVFTPVMNNTRTKNTNKGLLSVLVFIHGGYFMFLSGSQYGPRYIMDHDVVYVSFNYRLGVFGFLSTSSANENDAPGNAGMKDQVLALKWVQDNIHAFSGDKTRVTIYGESAGSVAVHSHLLSPMSKGLYSAAIAGSGTAFKVNSHQVYPVETAEKVAEEVGCGGVISNHTEMIECIRLVNASVIAALTDEFTKVMKDPLRIFSPSVEAADGIDPFFTMHPYEMLTNGLQNRVPWMAGVNSGEGFIITSNILQDEEWIKEINKNWKNGLSPEFLMYDSTNVALTDAIDAFYLNTSGAPNNSVDFQRDLLGFTNLFSDRMYIHASIEAVRLQANMSPVYLYYNDYMIDTNAIGLGTSHGEELYLLFSPGELTDPMIDEGHPDYEQSRKMVDLWVQFVTDPHNMYYNDRKWSPVTPLEESANCMIFKNANRGEQGVSKLPEEVMSRVNFWKVAGVPPYQEY